MFISTEKNVFFNFIKRIITLILAALWSQSVLSASVTGDRCVLLHSQREAGERRDVAGHVEDFGAAVAAQKLSSI